MNYLLVSLVGPDLRSIEKFKQKQDQNIDFKIKLEKGTEIEICNSIQQQLYQQTEETPLNNYVNLVTIEFLPNSLFKIKASLFLFFVAFEPNKVDLDTVINLQIELGHMMNKEKSSQEQSKLPLCVCGLGYIFAIAYARAESLRKARENRNKMQFMPQQNAVLYFREQMKKQDMQFAIKVGNRKTA